MRSSNLPGSALCALAALLPMSAWSQGACTVLAATATVSSTESPCSTNSVPHECPASASLDGDTQESSRWNSLYTMPQWIRYDLGSVKEIGSAQVYWGEMYPTLGQVQFSDNGSTWSDRAAISATQAGLATYSMAGSARYVRLYVTQSSGSWGVAVREAKICSGTSGGAGVPIAPNLIPAPSSAVTATGSAWTLGMGAKPTYAAGLEGSVGGWVDAVLEEAQVSGATGSWELRLDAPSDSTGTEGYLLTVNDQGWLLRASTYTGLFYGIQSVRQLMQAGTSVPAMSIVDRPATSWRGLMIDVARNFLGFDYLTTVIDQMATLKMNRLHLHLSDDQGWRLEILSYPQLTAIGSASSVEGLATQGYLTQAQWAQLNTYARLRGVVLVPEFDLPGHSHAVKAAYPAFGCGTDRGWPYRDIEVGFSKLCWDAGTQTFLTALLEELASITPGPWIHLGGDEVTSMPAYSASITYMENVLAGAGKIAIGWEEATVGMQQASSIWQKWNPGYSSGRANWINSTCNEAYLDHTDGGSSGGTMWMSWCTGMNGGSVNQQTVYSMTPGTIGLEVALWSEYVPSGAVAQEKLFPRLIASGEAGWTPAANKNYSGFTSRLALLGESWFTGVLVPVGTVSDVTGIEEESTRLQPELFATGTARWMDLQGRTLGAELPTTRGIYLKVVPGRGVVERRVVQ